MADKTIYDLDLHEELRIGDTDVTAMRVPGGWIYFSFECINGTTRASAFVPYSDEFGPKAADQPWCPHCCRGVSE